MPEHGYVTAECKNRSSSVIEKRVADFNGGVQMLIKSSHVAVISCCIIYKLYFTANGSNSSNSTKTRQKLR